MPGSPDRLELEFYLAIMIVDRVEALTSERAVAVSLLQSLADAS